MRFSFRLASVALMGTFVSGFSAVSVRALRIQPSRVSPSQAGVQVSLQSTTINNNEHCDQHHNHLATTLRGGETKDCPATGPVSVLSSLWGTMGVLYILSKAIKRVLPIALEPFSEAAVSLTPFQLGSYIATVLWFAYVEGYKGFQLKFSPLVVKRSFTLVPGKNGTNFLHFLLAPLYSMGLMHATKKRKIVSWSVTIGVTAIVAAVKRLPYPYRNIVDAGVVAGLSWGSLSIVLYYLKTWMTGEVPANVSAELPEAP